MKEAGKETKHYLCCRKRPVEVEDKIVMAARHPHDADPDGDKTADELKREELKKEHLCLIKGKILKKLDAKMQVAVNERFKVQESGGIRCKKESSPCKQFDGRRLECSGFKFPGKNVTACFYKDKKCLPQVAKPGCGDAKNRVNHFLEIVESHRPKTRMAHKSMFSLRCYSLELPRD